MPAPRPFRRLIEPRSGVRSAGPPGSGLPVVALRLFLLGLLLRPIGPWWVRGPLLAEDTEAFLAGLRIAAGGLAIDTVRAMHKAGKPVPEILAAKAELLVR